MRTIASSGRRRSGSGTSSTRTSSLPCQTTAFIHRRFPGPIHVNEGARREPAGARPGFAQTLLRGQSPRARRELRRGALQLLERVLLLVEVLFQEVDDLALAQ